jgi:hypothetical protein
MGSNRFATVREAKEYLAGKIAEQAVREGAPLSEVERKMLYFSETDWTLPDMMKVSEEFDREYDQDEYERKIGGLVRRLLEPEDEQAVETWDDAVVKISDEDHYMLVLINSAPSTPIELPAFLRKLGPWLPSLDDRGPRPPGDGLRLFVMGFGLFLVFILIVIVSTSIR